MTYHFDHASFAQASDPFSHFAELRLNAPVYWSPELKGWILTTYEDVRRTLRSDDYSVNRMQPFFDSLNPQLAAQLPDLKTLIPLWLVFRDPPDHTRLRRLMSPGFLPAAIRQLKPRVEELVESLIDELEGREEIDLIGDFALRLSGTVILDLLGLPREDLGAMRDWSNDLQVFIGQAQGIPEKYARAQRGTAALADYFRSALQGKRAKPGNDLLTMLASAGDNGEQFSEDEILAICILIFFGGHETTTNLIGNGFLALLRSPDQLAALRADASLADRAVEECLRYDGPGGAIVRVITRDHEVRGHSLRKGERVFAMVTAANRDPEKFEDPDKLNIRRKDNPHLTFGQGIHFCLGAPLARLEASVALPRLVSRLAEAKVATEQLKWRDAIVQRGLHALPLRLKSND